MWKDCSEAHQTTYPSSPEIAERDCEVCLQSLRTQVVHEVSNECSRILTLSTRLEQVLLKLPSRQSGCVVAERELVAGGECIEHETCQSVRTAMWIG